MYEEVVSFLFGIAASALIPTVIPLIFRWLERSNQKELLKNYGKEHVTLRLPWPFFWIGVLSTIVSSIIAIGIVRTPGKSKILMVILVAIMVLMVALGVFTISSYFTWKIDLFKSADFLIYRNYIGRSYEIKYEDVLYYKNKTQSIVVVGTKKKFSVDYIMTNYQCLIDTFLRHGIKELGFDECKDMEYMSEFEREHDNMPIEKPKPRKHRFYSKPGNRH